MAKNIVINILNESGTYEELYPQTLGSLVSGAVANATNAVNATSATSATNASKATKADTLTTARNLTTLLTSTAAGSFNGSANVNIGVSGILPVANGGTGYNNLNSLKSALGISSSSGLIAKTGSYTGNGSAVVDITVSGMSQIYLGMWGWNQESGDAISIPDVGSVQSAIGLDFWQGSGTDENTCGFYLCCTNWSGTIKGILRQYGNNINGNKWRIYSTYASPYGMANFNGQSYHYLVIGL